MCFHSHHDASLHLHCIPWDFRLGSALFFSIWDSLFAGLMFHECMWPLKVNDLDKVIWTITFEEDLHIKICVGENSLKSSHTCCSTNLDWKANKPKSTTAYSLKGLAEIWSQKPDFGFINYSL